MAEPAGRLDDAQPCPIDRHLALGQYLRGAADGAMDLGYAPARTVQDDDVESACSWRTSSVGVNDETRC